MTSPGPVAKSMGHTESEPPAIRRVPATDAALVLEHVEGCLCRHVCVQTVAIFPEANLIDARCIAAYLVPREGR